MNEGRISYRTATLPLRGAIAENTIVEDVEGMHAVSLDALHLLNGRIFISGEINQGTGLRFCSEMLHMADEQKEVDIYIDSNGGEINTGLLMYDIIQSYPYAINLYCVGMAASMGALLLAGGQKGRRFILPHSKVMIHEPLVAGGFGGSATTIAKTAQTILETKSLVNGIIAKHTGKTLAQINAATAFDNFMNAEEAVAFGLCDSIRHLF